ncbi:monofunctional biosynthetic peptidoglycan transglycosylase [Beijerinckia sp. L45]|uniref:monofunctional biosynthetic peptidoglycan transglycosylase n=1 Tax=Beijerinckia sp. L45 TaxID=1641855 RepID=UPI00131C97C5|nr:monofunctional biosynthetic peptidoglycan transglycosylase [Beijerinckia sp. L45]
MAIKGRRRGVIGKLVRCAFYGALLVALILVGLVLLEAIVPPVSTLMLARTVQGESYERDYVPLAAIAPVAVASVIASEDARFCRHHGVDWDALHDVMADADEDGPSRGASTITMQTAKNLFLWPWHSAIRKGLEIVVALGLDQVWPKTRIIEVYLNIAEWGDGIFGIEAAARHYFGKSASHLDAREGALLATALPNPIRRNPAHPSAIQRRLAANLMGRARDSAPWLDCLPGTR